MMNHLPYDEQPVLFELESAEDKVFLGLKKCEGPGWIAKQRGHLMVCILLANSQLYLILLSVLSSNRLPQIISSMNHMASTLVMNWKMLCVRISLTHLLRSVRYSVQTGPLRVDNRHQLHWISKKERINLRLVKSADSVVQHFLRNPLKVGHIQYHLRFATVGGNSLFQFCFGKTLFHIHFHDSKINMEK